MAAEEEETPIRPRLQDRIPVDEVAPQHAEIHALLVRWGRWNWTRKGGTALASAESLYCKVTTPPSTAPMASDPALMALERVVIRMPAQHGITVRKLYIFRWTPYTICSFVRPRLRYEAWPAWVFSCRAMVVNLLRRHGA